MKQSLSAQDRQEIQNLLVDFIDTFPTQSHAVARLENCSEATVINILSNKWDKVSDAMWNNVGSQLGFRQRESLQIVETLAFQTLILYFGLAQQEGAFFSITSPGGRGKTTAGDYYERVNRANNVFKLNCEVYWTKRIFLEKLLRQLGRRESGLTIPEMFTLIVKTIRSKRQPLLIIDQVGKLPIPVLLLFIALYNEVEGKCGIVWLSTEDIVSIINKGLRRNAPGFQELSSRFGNAHIPLPAADIQEVRQLCHYRGITDREEVARIYNEFNGDIRRIDREHLKSTAKKHLSKPKKAAA